MNNFKIGDWVECINPCTGITLGRVYQVIGESDTFIRVMDDSGIDFGYYPYRFKLYQPSLQHVKPEEVMNNQSDTVLADKYIKEFLKRLEYVLWNDTTLFGSLQCRTEELTLDSDIATIYGVDDIYTYINNSYDQLTSQAAQKRKLELLDKKAKLDLELAQINSELEGL